MNASRLLLAATALTLSFSASLVAQDVEKIVRILQEDPAPPKKAAHEKPENPPAPAPTPTPLLYLRDGGKVAGFPRLEALDVETRYGTLRVPRQELTSVRFARRVNPAIQENIDRFIAQLGDEDFDRREEAMNELRKIELPALSSLREAMKSSANEEVKTRAEALVDEFGKLQEKEGKKPDSLPQVTGTQDEVVTERMTIRGRVVTESFVVESRFGELTILAADLQGITFRPPSASSRRMQITPSHQPPGNWLDTRTRIEKGQSLRIEASGTIHVSNYGVSSNPAGTRQWGGTGFAGFPMLALIGKIGKNGKPFLVGTQHKSKTNRGGKVYLAVVPFTHYPQGAAGSYQVKIRVSGGP